MTKQEFRDLIAKQIIMLDGATGTELSARGMPQGVCPEKWILENPSAIRDVQCAYEGAGSRILYAPTFGGNRLKLEEFGLAGQCFEINRDLALLSKQNLNSAYVFGDLAPTGLFVQPNGELAFEDAVDVYKEQVKGLLAGGVDGFVVETMMDLQEARAALLAVKESCDLPVMVTMTFDENQVTLTGCDPVACLVALQSLGADAFGCNCSTGPEKMLEVIKMLKPHARIPLVAKPNAGMPKLVDGKACFDMGPDEFGGYVKQLTAAGVNILGGCCGTTPGHINAASTVAAECTPVSVNKQAISAISSSRKCRLLDFKQPFSVIGERINPTGKKALQAELRDGKMGIVKQFAFEQGAKGADILDVNMGLSGINEQEMMLKALGTVTSASDLPLCIDSTSPEVIEQALRYYPGRALVNSISAEKERLEKTLPIAAKYGAMFILLPLTDDGIPETCADRIKVVETIFDAAQNYGFSKEDLTIDGLIMTISSNQEAANVSLDLIEWSRYEFGVNTVCGLSNVSFGMPQRKWINSAFLGMAMGRGLTMAIANPSSDILMETVRAGNRIRNND